MKLTLRLTAILLAVTFLLFSVDAIFMVRRQVAKFEREYRNELELLGWVLTSALNETWRSRGADRAKALISDINRGERSHLIVWIEKEDLARRSNELGLSAADLESINRGHKIYKSMPLSEQGDSMILFRPVEYEGEIVGALEISQPLTNAWEEVQDRILNVILLYLALIVVGVALTFVTGRWLVGTPIEQLIARARQIGSGRLEGEVTISGRDELSDLANEMNLMGQQLKQSRQRVEEESTARLGALEQLRHADRLASAGRLAAGIAHELGTPLNIVAGQASLMMSESMAPGEVQESARQIKSQSDRMVKLVQQFLDLARRRPPLKSRIQLDTLVSQIVQLLIPLATKRQVSIKLAPELPASPIFADGVQIQQAVTNLVMNAVQASTPGSKVAVSLTHREPDLAEPGAAAVKQAMVAVTDSGSGIAEKDIPYIFDPFFTTKEQGEGTGLGLSISHGIVREHDGWIEVTSSPGRGSTFKIFLPMME